MLLDNSDKRLDNEPLKSISSPYLYLAAGVLAIVHPSENHEMEQSVVNCQLNTEVVYDHANERLAVLVTLYLVWR